MFVCNAGCCTHRKGARGMRHGGRRRLGAVLGHAGPRAPHAFHPKKNIGPATTAYGKRATRVPCDSAVRTARSSHTAHRSRRRSWASSCSSTRVACDACDSSRAYGEGRSSAPKTRCTVGSHASSTSYTPWSIVVARGRTTRVPWRTV